MLGAKPKFEELKMCFLVVMVMSSLVWINGVESVQFKCEKDARCGALIGYMPPNATKASSVAALFMVESVEAVLAANSWPLNDSNRPIPAGSVVRVPFPCKCTDKIGVSDRKPNYTVVKDDGLDHIAREIFGAFVTYQEIARVNNIPDPNRILVGQELWIPLPCSCDDADGARAVHYGHVVANGSSVEQIAAEFGTNSATLMDLNSATLSDPKQLKAGSILDVPLKACNSSIENDSLDSSLLVASGATALTANNCVQCTCRSTVLQLECVEAKDVKISKWKECPAMECQGDLSLGERRNTTCLQTTCSYGGYTSTKINTLLVDQPTCASPSNSSGISLHAWGWMLPFLSLTANFLSLSLTL